MRLPKEFRKQVSHFGSVCLSFGGLNFSIMSTSAKKLFLLDGFALIYRSFFALNRPNKDGTTSLINPKFRNSSGLNTSAMFTFTNSLMQVLEKEKPTHIAMVMDTPEPTFRHELFKEYKANRPPMPDDLRLAIPYVIRIIEGFNIPILQQAGYEADDLIGTIACKAEKSGFEVFMMTSDKDYAQLVTRKVKMYRPGRSGSEVEIWDVEKVKEKFGVENPIQVIDYLGLMGDKSDNIPGIPGVGDKTARKFLSLYGSMEGLYEHIDELKGKMKEKVEANFEMAKLSKVLATIITDVPIEINESDWTLQPLDKDKIRSVFTELEFRTLWRRALGEEPLGKAAPKAASPGKQMELFENGTPTPDAGFAQKKTIETTQHHYHFTDTFEKRQELIKVLEKADSISFDTETTGVDALRAALVGISFAVKPGEAWYVPVSADHNEAKAIVNEFAAVFADPLKEKIGQNIKYDMHILSRYGIEVAAPHFDTMVAHYLLYPDARHNMDVLADRFLNYTTVSITTLIGKKGKNQLSMRDIPQENISDYACEDADITLQLKEKFAPMLVKKGAKKLFDEVEMPLIPVLVKMEREGICLEVDALHKLSEELVADLQNIQKAIYEAAGGEFLISSPKQVGEVLFDQLKIMEKPKKTKTGQYATSEDVLNKLTDKHPIVQHILDYRELTKLKNTYVDVLPSLVNPDTGHIHTTFNQVVAATGRLSSDHPNLQNIPIRTERGRQVRKSFVPRSDRHTLLAADYSQIELRIIAAISKDEGMMSAFRNDLDIHASTASKVFGVPLKEVTREMRRKAKAVNFGIAYGQGAFGLAQNLNISRKEAKEIIDNYFDQFGGVHEYMGAVVEKARAKGYCETILGRRRYLRGIDSPNAIERNAAERLAINAPIQGSAADMIKIAMIDVQNMLEKGNYKTKMLLQVHDELVFDVPDEELEEMVEKIARIMSDAIKTEVPIKVEAGVGKTWLEAH